MGCQLCSDKWYQEYQQHQYWLLTGLFTVWDDSWQEHQKVECFYCLGIGNFLGQLQYIIVVHCQATSDRLGIICSTTIILAAIRTCKVKDKNTLAASVLDIHDYSAMRELHVMDITGVQCLIGRVKDGSRWSIIDRSDWTAQLHVNLPGLDDVGHSTRHPAPGWKFYFNLYQTEFQTLPLSQWKK